MASDMNLVLSPPLCFLAKRYDKLSSKVVRNALIDFYEPSAIWDAKQQLKIDIDSLVVQHGLIFLDPLQPAVVNVDAALCDNLPASNSWTQVIQSANERTATEASAALRMRNQRTSQQGGDDKDSGPYQLVVSRRSQRTKRRRVQSRENTSDRQYTSSSDVNNDSELEVTNRMTDQNRVSQSGD